MAIAADHFTVRDLAQFEGRNGRHELLDGALLVTPLGSSRHQSLCLALGAALRAYVLRERIGAVFAPGRVIVDDRTALETDVLVVPGADAARQPWESHPAPLLAVEVLSPSTRSFDHLQKRAAYLRRGAAEYWIVDSEKGEMLRVRPGLEDEVTSSQLVWAPGADVPPLVLALPAMFAEQ
ncbi:MAG: Uma2 family endonuclease [Gemmatimonadetes bacterium]|nr:Uma2 family endonuclease [Gemmatimonadota bacterium]